MEVMYPRCAGLDVHAGTVVACARIAAEGMVTYEHRTVTTTSRGLLELADWLTAHGCTHVAMEAWHAGRAGKVLRRGHRNRPDAPAHLPPAAPPDRAASEVALRDDEHRPLRARSHDALAARPAPHGDASAGSDG
jgi:hypothetical protein